MAGDADWAVVLTVGGGLLLVLGVALVALYVVSTWGALGAILGLVLMALGVALRQDPRHRRELGAAICAVAVLSLTGGLDLFLGGLLALVGGLLALTSRGTGFFRPMVAPGFVRAMGSACPRCGRMIPSWTSTCPYCRYPEG
jgi:hypothetical protein